MSWIHDYPQCLFSACIELTRVFYTRHFAAAINLDLGWYLSLQVPGCQQTLRFIGLDEWAGRNRPGQTYNIAVADVDIEIARLRAGELHPATSVQDFGWGDRAFYVTDPNGLFLYIHSDGELSPEILECIRKYG